MASATYRFLRALGLQKEELGGDECGHLVVHGAVDEYDPLLQQPRVQVESPLARLGALEDHRYHVERSRLSREVAAQTSDEPLCQLAKSSAHLSSFLDLVPAFLADLGAAFVV